MVDLHAWGNNTRCKLSERAQRRPSGNACQKSERQRYKNPALADDEKRDRLHDYTGSNDPRRRFVDRIRESEQFVHM